jgi:hypothetical protein
MILFYGAAIGGLVCVVGGIWLQRKMANTSANEILREV